MTRTAWPPHQTVKPLLHAHRGRPGVVMGGGESLGAGMAQAPQDAVYVSANDHGVRWLADHPNNARRCSYVVACDKIEPRARKDVRPGKGQAWGVPIIGRYMWADYRLLRMPGRLTGQVAAWLARFMGCSPIILLGMDLYAGGTYYDAPQARSSGKHQSARQHLSYWDKLAKEYPAQYRVIGGHSLLQARLGVYDATEPVDQPAKLEQLEREIEARTVRIVRPAMIRFRQFAVGTIIDVSVKEAAELFKERKAVPV